MVIVRMSPLRCIHSFLCGVFNNNYDVISEDLEFDISYLPKYLLAVFVFKDAFFVTFSKVL